jgi:hypothetical protein
MTTNTMQLAPPDEPITGPITMPSGRILLDKGLPAAQWESDRLYDQLDYQRACQTYL